MTQNAWHSLIDDITFAVRRLRSRPAGVLGIVLMLVVGIGLATTMFALSDPFLTRPLPYARAERLVIIQVRPALQVSSAGLSQSDYPLLEEWQARGDLFEGLAAFMRHDVLRVRSGNRAFALEALAVSSNFFRVLGVPVSPPATETAGDEGWLLTGAASTAALGGFASSTLSLVPSGSLQVAGILPASFIVPAPNYASADVLLELAPGPIAVVDGPSTSPMTLVGRLRDVVEPPQVAAALNEEAARRGFGVTVLPLSSAMREPQRPSALGALAAGLLLLLVCAANTLGIALTRALYRVQQVATMQVLGASSARIARQFLAEAICVAGAGAAGALSIVPLVLNAVIAVVPRSFIALGEPEVSGRVVVFGCMAGLFAGVGWWLGSLVAWGRGAPGFRVSAWRDGRVVRAVRFGVVVGQVSVTLVLLGGAGVLVRSYLNLVGQDTGLAGETLALSVSYRADLRGAALREVMEQTTEAIRRLPGVARAAVGVGDMADQSDVTGMAVIGRRPVPVELLAVSADYFDAAGMTFLDGRPLMGSDAGGQGVVVSESFVVRYFGGKLAPGDHVQIGGAMPAVVGVVRDSRRSALDRAPRPAVFRVLDDRVPSLRVTYLARGLPAAAPLMENVIRRVAWDAVILDASTLRDRLARTIRDRVFATLVVSLFAFATVVVTMAGVVAVVGYSVARRTREMGIRLAVGATPMGVTWLVMRDTLRATVVGVAVGLLTVLWFSGLLTNLVFGISPRDWVTLAATTLVLVGLSALAALGPARRAGRLSPTVALRDE